MIRHLQKENFYESFCKVLPLAGWKILEEENFLALQAATTTHWGSDLTS